MDLALLVYAISTISSIKILLGLLIALSAFACLGLLIYLSDQYGDSKKPWIWKRIKIWFGIGLFCSFISVLLPSQKTAYTMVGAYAAQRVAENEKVQQLSSKVLTIIEQRLDGYIQEGIDNSKEKDVK